jgi:TonB family protein
MKIMMEKSIIKPHQFGSTGGNQKFHALFPVMLLLLSWMFFAVVIAADAAEYEATAVDSPPKLVRQQPINYPPQAKRDKVEGRVVVRCLITAGGKADKMEVVESEPAGVFDESALKSVKYWQFRPGVLKGEMVDTWIKIPLSFKP